jgi:hypothetical protein
MIKEESQRNKDCHLERRESHLPSDEKEKIGMNIFLLFKFIVQYRIFRCYSQFE